MNRTKIIETTIAAAAVIGLAAILPLTGTMGIELLIGGALAAMGALEVKERCF